MATIIDRHRSKVVALCQGSAVRRLDAFGSATRDDFDPANSDLDFFVEMNEIPPREYADAYFALKNRLEQLFGRPVDLVTELDRSPPPPHAALAAHS